MLAKAAMEYRVRCCTAAVPDARSRDMIFADSEAVRGRRAATERSAVSILRDDSSRDREKLRFMLSRMVKPSKPRTRLAMKKVVKRFSRRIWRKAKPKESCITTGAPDPV